MRELNMDRPLAVFDIESTGTNRSTDRIIDLAIVKILPGGKRETHVFRVNPGMPIPPDSSAIHGIYDDDVKDAPAFEAIAADVASVLENCDLGGFNILGFDIPMLCAEFARSGIPFDLTGRRVLDAQRIFHRKVPRDLPAALAYYCGEMHLNAHQAIDDVDATIRVIEGQLQKYPDLPRDMDGLDEYCNPRDPSWVDRTGKFKWDNGEIVVNFGRNAGKSLRDMVAVDTGFLKWVLNKDFPQDVKDLVRNALSGVFPSPPEKDDDA